MGIYSFRRTIERPYLKALLSQHSIKRLFHHEKTFTMTDSVEVNAKSVKVNAHTGQNTPGLWALTLSFDPGQQHLPFQREKYPG